MYQYTESDTIIKRLTDNAYIPCNLENPDYRLFLLWLDEGNIPTPAPVVAPEIAAPSINERLEAAELMIDLMLDTQQGGA